MNLPDPSGGAIFPILTVVAALVAAVGFSIGRPRGWIVALTTIGLLAGGAWRQGATDYLMDLPRVMIHPAPLTVAGMLLISAAIERSPLLFWLEKRLERLTRLSPRLGTSVFFLGAGILSSLMNNTPLVATGIAVSRRLARRWKISPQKLLMPLAFAANAGGVCLLVGTSTNLVVAGIVTAHGLPPIGIWALLPVGIPLLLGGAALLYLYGFDALPEKPANATLEHGVSVGSGPSRWSLFAAGTILVVGWALHWPLVGLVWAVGGALLLTRALPWREALRTVRWDILMVIWTMMTVGSALEASGLAATLAEWFFVHLGGIAPSAWGPLLLLFAVVVITSVLTEMVSNNATAAIIAPLVLSLAERLSLPPLPFALAVCVAASACFASPIGYQTNTMVFRAGNYTVGDFLRVGLPFNLLYALGTPLLLWGMYF